jgi:hypothetical protein
LLEHTRWAVLKGAETTRTQNQESALLELVEQGFATAKAYRVKELLRWVRRAESKQAAKWRITHFLKHATEYAANSPPLGPVLGALASFERHLPRNAFLAHQCAARRVQWPVPGSEGQSQGIPKRGKFYHHGLLDCGPDSGSRGFMNSTSNDEEPIY